MTKFLLSTIFRANCTIFIRLFGGRFVFDNSHTANFSALHNVVAGYEVNHCGAHFCSQFR